jgi:CBS domain-containing protein
MNIHPDTVSPETPLSNVLERMVVTRHRSFPVVEGDRLVGMISREDVVRALRCAQSRETPDTDAISRAS